METSKEDHLELDGLAQKADTDGVPLVLADQLHQVIMEIQNYLMEILHLDDPKWVYPPQVFAFDTLLLRVDV